MHDDILNLALELSKITGEKIGSIDQIMVKTQILAMNARLEAARAGEHGRSFGIVAQEMGSVTEEVSRLSADLNKAISDNASRIEAAGRNMLADFRGQRFADLARNAVEIIDRNLYERSCDVRWWATDSAVVNAVQVPSREACAHASERLATILRSYTVYLDLWIADANGVIVANGRPERYRDVVGHSARQEEWFCKGMATANGDAFAVVDIERNNHLEGATVATYSTAIRQDGRLDGRALGVLGIFFDWAPQAGTIVREIALSDEERASTRVMLLDAKHRIIAAHPEAHDGATFPIEAAASAGHYRKGNSLIAYARTPGYETYAGLGWFGCLESKLSA